MGAECIISGIRPQIAQTVVALGIEFGDIPTKATLADALRHVLRPGRIRHRPPRRAAGVMERIPIYKIGDVLLVSIQIDLQDQDAINAAGRPRRPDRRHRRRRRRHRHLRAGGRRQLHRSDAVHHRRGVARARRPDGRRRHASGGGDHARRARPVAARRRDRARRRAGPRPVVGAQSTTRPTAMASGDDPDDVVMRATVRTDRGSPPTPTSCASAKLVRPCAARAGLSLVDQTKLITAASELARNTLVYGGGGEAALSVRPRRSPDGVRVVFVDHGPGHRRRRTRAAGRMDQRHGSRARPVRVAATGRPRSRSRPRSESGRGW